MVGYAPFDNFFPDKDRLIEEWLAFFGDLAQEWCMKLENGAVNGA